MRRAWSGSGPAGEPWRPQQQQRSLTMRLGLAFCMLSAGSAVRAARPDPRAAAAAALGPPGVGRQLLRAKPQAAAAAPPPLRAVIIPGMGVFAADHFLWYKDLADRLGRLPGTVSVLKTMPDPIFARKRYWWDFMKGDLGIDANTVIVGHSSGAQAAMRWAEKHKVAGLVLVSPAPDDMGMWLEKNSGWYDRPFRWQAIQKNSGFILQLSGRNDLLIPYDTQMRVAQALNAEVHTFDNAGHFVIGDQSQLLDLITSKLEAAAAKRRPAAT